MAKVNSIILVFVFGFFCLVNSNPPTAIDSIVSILDEYYISTLIQTFNGKKPSELRMNDDEIYLKIGDATHYYKRGDKSSNTRKLKYNVTFESKQYLIDDSGNRVTIDKNGFVYLKHEKFDEKLKVMTDGGITKQITNDANRKLIFVLAGSNVRQKEYFVGTLYVFNSKKPVKLGGRVISHVVENFKNKVLAIFVEKTKGTVLIALEEPENQWSLTVLDPLKSIVCPPPPNIKSINKKALLAAISLAAEEIVETYESSLIDEKKSNAAKTGLITNMNKNTVFYANAGSTRQESEWDLSFEGESGDFCMEWKNKLNETEVKVKTTEAEYNKLWDQIASITKIKMTKEIKPNQVIPEDNDKYVCFLKKDVQDLTNNLENLEEKIDSTTISSNKEAEFRIDPRFN